MNLVVVHRRGPERLKPSLDAPPSAWLQLQTCLRHILMGPRAELDLWELGAIDEIFTGMSAYRFCLEVICGLQTLPLVGRNRSSKNIQNGHAEFHVASHSLWLANAKVRASPFRRC